LKSFCKIAKFFHFCSPLYAAGVSLTFAQAIFPAFFALQTARLKPALRASERRPNCSASTKEEIQCLGRTSLDISRQLSNIQVKTSKKSKRKTREEDNIMSITGLEVFDTTLQKTHAWLNDIMQELGWEDERQRAYLALRSVLHALRDRLTVEEALDFGAQLPMLIRGFYYEGWKTAGKPLKERHKTDFLAHVRQDFRDDERMDPERIARAVFHIIARRISAGEITDIKRILPAELRELWSFAPEKP